MKKKNKIISLFLTFMLLFTISSNSFAFADSGASALPKDDPKAAFIFKTFPKSWTSYHTLTTQKINVSKMVKEGNELMAISNIGANLSAIGNIGNIVTKSKLAVTLGKGAVIAGAGMGVCYLTGYGMTVAVKDLKADTKLVKKVAFKWTDTKKLNYSVRIQCWNEYNGKKISSTKTYYRTGSYR